MRSKPPLVYDHHSDGAVPAVTWVSGSAFNCTSLGPCQHNRREIYIYKNTVSIDNMVPYRNVFLFLVIGINFMKYMEAFKPMLTLALKNIDEYQVLQLSWSLYKTSLSNPSFNYDGLRKVSLLYSWRLTLSSFKACIAAVAIVGDLCRAFGEQVLPFCDEFMNLLMANLAVSIISQLRK